MFPVLFLLLLTPLSEKALQQIIPLLHNKNRHYFNKSIY